MWLLRLTFVQSLIATLWSLYYGRFGDPIANISQWLRFPWNGYTPCELCRFARVLMYPIVMIALIWLIRRDPHASKTILPFALLGIGLESYQYYIQKFASTVTVNKLFCQPWHPCAAIDVQYRWFVTIPFLCLVAFIIIAVLCTWHIYQIKKSDPVVR